MTATANALATAAEQVKAQATSTAQAQITSTAVARWTSVAQTAEACKKAPTTTAIALDSYVKSLLVNKTLVLGSENGSLKHNPCNGYIEDDEYQVNINNLAIEIRFYNPYAASQV